MLIDHHYDGLDVDHDDAWQWWWWWAATPFQSCNTWLAADKEKWGRHNTSIFKPAQRKSSTHNCFRIWCKQAKWSQSTYPTFEGLEAALEEVLCCDCTALCLKTTNYQSRLNRPHCWDTVTELRKSSSISVDVLVEWWFSKISQKMKTTTSHNLHVCQIPTSRLRTPPRASSRLLGRSCFQLSRGSIGSHYVEVREQLRSWWGPRSPAYQGIFHVTAPSPSQWPRCAAKMKVQGEFEFGLIYSSSLDIIIKQCWHLSPIDLRRNRSDPYVKVDTSSVWISVWHSDLFWEKWLPQETKIKSKDANTLCPIYSIWSQYLSQCSRP